MIQRGVVVVNLVNVWQIENYHITGLVSEKSRFFFQLNDLRHCNDIFEVFQIEADFDHLVREMDNMLQQFIHNN
jgi:hypothetical protein